MAESIAPPIHFSQSLDVGETYPGQTNIDKRAAFSYPLVTNRLRSYSFTGTVFYFNGSLNKWIEFPNVETAIREFTYRRQSTRLEEIALGANLLFENNIIEEVNKFIKLTKLTTAEKPAIIKHLKEANITNIKDNGFDKIYQKIRVGKTWFEYLEKVLNDNIDQEKPDLGDILESRRIIERASLEYGKGLLSKVYQAEDQVYRGNLGIYLDVIKSVVESFMSLKQIKVSPYRQAAYYTQLALVGVNPNMPANQYLLNGLIKGEEDALNINYEQYWQGLSLKETEQKYNQVYNDNWKSIKQKVLERLQNAHHRIYHALFEGEQAYEAVIKERKDIAPYKNSSLQNE